MATLQEPQFTLGIEEEYLLVDAATMELVSDPPSSILDECQRLTPKQVSPELLRSQIEVGTTVCSSIDEARNELSRLRGIVIDAARHEGLAPIAASTHPVLVDHDHEVENQDDLEQDQNESADTGKRFKHFRMKKLWG